MNTFTRNCVSAPSRLRWFGGVTVAVCLAVPLRAAAQGIPEPDIVLYGSIVNVRSNANLRLGYGTLTWIFQPSGGGPSLAFSTVLTNIADQFSYILRIPCETPVAGYAASSNTVQLLPSGTSFDRSQITWLTNTLGFVQPALALTTISTADRGRIERIDLDASVPVVFDSNGLPIDWELYYFGRTGLDPNSDPDHDGLTLMQEYLAGLDPTAPHLRFTGIQVSQGGTTIEWSSVSNQVYALQRTSNLSIGFADLVTNISASPPLNTFSDTNAAGLGPFFYRLRLEQ